MKNPFSKAVRKRITFVEKINTPPPKKKTTGSLSTQMMCILFVKTIVSEYISTLLLVEPVNVMQMLCLPYIAEVNHF